MSDAISSPLPNTTKVFLVDDHRLMIMGLKYVLGDEPDFVVCGSADSAESALEWIEATQPDIVTLDISIKGDVDGIELARLLTVKYPKMPVVMLSMHDIAAYGVRAREAGASGYLSKGDAPSFLVKALRRVLAGHQAFGPADLVESVSDW